MRIIYLISILILLPNALFGNQSQCQLVFDHLSTVDGLSNSSVNAIAQDKYGFLWFGTDDGLNKFDGYNFTVYKYNPDDSASISGNRIMELYIDNKGNLWAGAHQGGINKYNYQKDNFTRLYYKPDELTSLGKCYIKSIFQDSNGNLWIGTLEDGVFKYNTENGKFSWFSHIPGDESSLNNNDVFSIIEDRYGDIWFGTNGKGISKYDAKNNSFVQYKIPGENKLDKAITFGKTLFEDSEGNFWIGTEGKGIYHWNRLNDNFTHYFENDNSLTNNTITCFYENGDQIWIGTDGGGLNSYDKNTGKFSYCKRNYFFPERLSSDAVLSIFKDKHNSIWIGTFGGGINIHHPNNMKYQFYSEKGGHPGGLSHSSVISIFEDSKGYIWVGTDGGGLNKFDPINHTFESYTHNKNKNSISSNVITAIFEDSKKNLWIGTYMQGLNLFDRKNNRFINFRHDINNPNSISHNNIWCIYETSEGKLLIGTFGAGIDIFDYTTKSFQNFRNIPSDKTSLSHDNIIIIYEGRDKNIWIGTGTGGVNLFDIEKGTFKRYMHDPENPESISYNDIYDIYEDNNGNLWIATNHGLNLFNKITERFKSFTVEEGLPSNTIQNIIDDGQGYLWLSTGNGISKFEIASQKFTNFTGGNGIENNNFNYSASIMDRRGRIYFGGINGLIVFKPEELVSNQEIPEVVINKLVIFNKTAIPGKPGSPLVKPIYNTDEIKLKRKQNSFTLEFVAMNFINPMKNEYAYKLEGYDKEWIYTDASRRFATYSNLPGGSYYFKVKASNNDGIWNETGRTLKIIIIPPFYKTYIFYILVILIIALCVYLIVKSKVKQLERMNVLLDQKVKMRTVEIDNQKSEIEAQRDEIELQKQVLIDQKQKIEDQNKKLLKQREELENEVQERTKDLETAKLKAEESDNLKTAFLTNLSHEIRTPMNAIIGFSSLLADTEVTDEQRNEFINHINHNSITLLHMIDDIIDVSKIESNTIEINKNECSLNVILIDLYSTYINYKSEIGKAHIDFRLSNPFKNENIKLLTDSYRFRQIYANLLNNAFKYTNEGYIEFGVKKDGDRYVYFVKDTGIGIPEDKKAIIFDRFTKADDDTSHVFRGTGVGLTLSRKLASLLGGYLWVETEQQVGSTFYFTIPHIIEKSERAESLDMDWSDKTIIVAEDEDENYLLFLNILNKTNAQIYRAINGQEVIDLYQKNKNVDAIVMDLRMPVMDGFDAIEKIRKIDEKIPVIAVTAYAFSVDRENILNLGFNDLILKPLKSNIFISTLMKYLGTK